MEKVVDKLSLLCWNVLKDSHMNVIPVKSICCNHEVQPVADQPSEIYLNEWPPTFACGCVADARDGKLSRSGRLMPRWEEIEELLEYLKKNPPPPMETTTTTTTNPDPHIERWLHAAEEMYQSDEDLVVVQETEDDDDEAESEDEEEMDISSIEMTGYQFPDYTMNYEFEADKTYHFHIQAYLHGHARRYRSGDWHPSLHKLYCMSCMASVNGGSLRAGEPLKFIGQSFNLTSDENGEIIIPYWFRPAYFLSDSGDDQGRRETLMDLISSMVLPRFAHSRQLRWEFHCSFCRKNLFTECVSDVTLYAI